MQGKGLPVVLHKKWTPWLLLGICVCSSWLATTTTAFEIRKTNNSHGLSRGRQTHAMSSFPLSLSANDGGGGNNFFENMFNNFWSGGDDDNNKEDDDDEMAAGTSLIASIPVKSIKPGGLRLFLMFYLMGMQNTPDPKSWRADQPITKTNNNDDGVPDLYAVEMLYHDATGMITVEMTLEEIRILRCGSVPSTAYLMQEAVIVQGILDELHTCAFEESVPPEDRLLIPEPLEAIDVARESLAFG